MTENSKTSRAFDRLEQGADQLRDLRINARTIYEAIDTKIDVERLIRRALRDLKDEMKSKSLAI